MGDGVYHRQGSLQQTVGRGLPQEEDLFDSEHKSEEAEERLRERLDNLDTLPTLPTIVTHIMRLISDPKTTIAELEELLSSDPAIVLKVVHVANSAVFAGTTSNRRWTLNEAILRLGLRKVGAIAQQIALINSFVRPEDSDFDMQRFWEHSVGCALMADKLVEGGHLKPSLPVEFNEYWICALLHDSGKLVQGFFFWELFERILRAMEGGGTFHVAEDELLGGGISHEFIGELLLRKAQMPDSLVRAVGLHHTTGDTPEPLTCILHVANNLTNEVGLGYTENAEVEYSRAVLDSLRTSRSDLRSVVEQIGGTVVGEVKQLVKQCLQ